MTANIIDSISQGDETTSANLLMPKPAKVLHHVRKLVASLSITSANDSDIDLIIKTLSDTYREYTLEPAGQLREAVCQAVSTVIAAIPIQPAKVMSLNQIVSNQYRNVPSKRHRPMESEEIFDDGDGAIAAEDVYRISTPLSRQAQHGGAGTTEGDRTQNKEKDSSVFSEDGETKAHLGSSSGKKRSRHKQSASKAENDQSSLSLSGKNDIESDIVSAILSKGRTAPSEFMVPRPSTRLCDMAGIDSITSQVKELVFYPVLYPGLYTYLGVQPPCGLLLHGPSGCGKTALAYAIAGELGLPFFKASGPELIGGTSGESEERIRGIFLAAAAKAPSVLFIDALDVIAGKKDSAQRGMDRRIVAQLFDSIDSIISLGEVNLKLGDDDTNDIPLSVKNKGAGGEDDKVLPGSIQTKNGLVVLIAATNK